MPASRLILVSRTPEELKEYADQGASVRFGDFTKPESLPAAYAGGTRMLLISVGGSGEVTAAALLKRAIDAAKAAGVKHIAYTSYVGITRGDVAGRAADHQATEDALKASGLAWTMLRNSIYMHGLINQAARMVADGRAVIPPNESTIGYVDARRLRAAAAAVLSDAGAREQGLRHHGPRAARRARDAAAVASAVTGKPIEVVQGGADVRPGFGRPAMSFTTSHFRRSDGPCADERAHAVRSEQDRVADAARAALFSRRRQSFAAGPTRCAGGAGTAARVGTCDGGKKRRPASARVPARVTAA